MNRTPCEPDRCPDCGGPQGSGLVTWHCGNCGLYSGPLPAESQIRAELVGKIANVCNELDRRYGNDPGRAERGLYSFYWPPSASTGIDVLCRLLDDARAFLAAAPATPVQRHSPVSRRSTKRTLPGRSPRTSPVRRGVTP
jgi:hypothetical protein